MVCKAIAQTILKEAIHEYAAKKYSKEELTYLFVELITEYIAADKSADETFELLAELEDGMLNIFKK